MEHQYSTNLKPQGGEKEAGRLFNSPVLEKLSRTSVHVPVIMYICIATAFLSYAFYTTTIALFPAVIMFVGGVLLWTLLEYWIHRHLYHYDTDIGWLQKIQYHGHHIHHQYPRDYSRLAMPPVPALVLLSLVFGLLYLIAGQYALVLFPGFVVGYMLYILLHYAFHRFNPPRFKPLRKLWTWHALHHYKYPESHAFGVSTTLWDTVFGTRPPQRKG